MFQWYVKKVMENVFMAKNLKAGISISINDSMLPSVCYTVIYMVRVGVRLG